MAMLKYGHPYNPNYALPQNVIDEPLGRGTFNGQYIPRGTIDTMVPEQFQGLGSLGQEGGHTLSKHTLSGTILGDTETRDHRAGAGGPPGFAGDPIAAYGTKAAGILLAATQKVPHDHRKPLLKEMLNHIDSTLWDRVATKATELQASKGYTAQLALRKALAICMASGLLGELDAIGKGNKRIKPRSHLGLGMYGVGDYQEALGFSFSSITGALSTAAKAVGGAVSTAAKATYNVGKTALNKVGGLACGAAGLASVVPPVTPATMGVAAGAAAVKGICGSGSKGAAAPPPPPQPGLFGGGGGFMSSSVAGIPLPLILAGGGLGLFLLLRKKSA